MQALLHQLIHTWFHLVSDWGYLGIVILMAMESSIFPVPSEVVIPPAAFWAAQGKMSPVLIILAGTFGSWLGSAITYGISRWLGRRAILKWGRYVFITPEKLERAERMMERYESGGLFFARLLPVVRHLISIPAGIIEMPFLRFSVITTIGSAIWCSILTWLGLKVSAQHPDLINDPDALIKAIKGESLWIIGVIVAFCGLYFLMMRLTSHRKPKAA